LQTRKGYAGADRARLAACKEDVDCADSRNNEAGSLGRKPRSLTVEPTTADVSAFEDASAKIKIAGARYPKFHEQLVGR